MVKKYKLQLGDVMEAIDRRHMSFLQKQDDDTKKGFAPPVVLRMASSTVGRNNERWLISVNERANVHFWDLYKHPDLQFRLLASCGTGSKERHTWIDKPKAKRDKETVQNIILRLWPTANQLEIDIIMAQTDVAIFTDMIRSLGYTIDEEREFVEAYKRIQRTEKSSASANG